MMYINEPICARHKNINALALLISTSLASAGVQCPLSCKDVELGLFQLKTWPVFLSFFLPYLLFSIFLFLFFLISLVCYLIMATCVSLATPAPKPHEWQHRAIPKITELWLLPIARYFLWSASVAGDAWALAAEGSFLYTEQSELFPGF